jgi:hypothetical protein
MLEKQFLLFKVEEENEDFTEIEVEDGPIYMFFDHFSIFVIVDTLNECVWIWHGEHASIRKKFITAQKAPQIRDNYGVGFKINAIDEGSEPHEFKNLVGL